MFPNSPDTTIVAILQYRAAHQAEKVAYRFLSDGERESESLTYRELDQRAKSIAAELLSWVKPGDRAVLLYPSGVEYVAAFFGCLYAGVIAVPAYPPAGNGNMRRLASIMQDCHASVILSVKDVIERLPAQMSDDPAEIVPCVIETERLPDAEGSEGTVHLPQLSGSMIAFLQYTSGSTADPKGVMVSHANIMHNERVLRDFHHLNEETIAVSWLPIYHDLGLLAGVIATTFIGGQIILMSPAAFIQRPARWLEAISRYRASFSGGPDFAYDLCTRQITAEKKLGLDLSCWTVAGNGAEPVREKTITEFTKAFAPCGFARNALRPCYGLAEGTLFVSSTSDEGPSSWMVDASSLEQNIVVETKEGTMASRAIVSCGCGPDDQKIVIVDPETCAACEENRVGEIWIASQSVARGYWNNPEVTEGTFRAHLADTGEGPFLRTGDLGFLRCGDLYVTGRQKDLIIINGRNHYPHDIELTAELSHPALVPGAGAAFSVEVEGQERLVIAYEVKRSHIRRLDREAIYRTVRHAVATQHELEVFAIELVRPLTIPKTSSGKVQRSLCRRKFLAGDLAKVTPGKLAATTNGSGAHGNSRETEGAMQFSLFYFSSNEAEFRRDKYKLLLEGAKFADQHGFTAVWVPERHFHAFGGLYPNPSVLASALAVITKRIRIRAGSVVLPLHNPVRVAEEWSVVDNLSSGRVDLAFARGWNPNDFTLAPSNYATALEVLLRNVETVRSLWRGNSLTVPNGKGEETEIKIYPLPHQKELPVWLTCSGGVERFVDAGTHGWNVLTALLFQSTEELAEKIKAYRDARERSGHDAKSGRVTLMLHTFMGPDADDVKRQVRGPLIEYLKSSADLWSQGTQTLAKLSESEREEVLNFAFERYYAASGLFGTPEGLVERVSQLARAGVDEIACLIDFGIETPRVLEGLHALYALQERVQEVGRRKIAIHADPAEDWTDAGWEKVLPAPSGSFLPKAGTHPAFSRTAKTHAAREFDETSPENQPLLQWVRHVVTEAIAQATQASPAAVITNKHFLSLGINSLKAIEIMSAIQQQLELELPHSLLFEFSTVDRLSAAVVREHREQIEQRMASFEAGDNSKFTEAVVHNGHGVAEQSGSVKVV